MKVSFEEDLDSFIAKFHDDMEARTHPWTISKRGGGEAYHDFSAHPELIRISLEDFRPWDHYPAIQRFYDLLRWLNGPDSCLESNDSAFSGPTPSEDAAVPGLVCSGRLMIFARQLELNREPDFVEQASAHLERLLSDIDQTFDDGWVSLSYWRTWFTTLGSTPVEALGVELVLTFLASGESEESTMANLERVITGIWTCLTDLNEEVPTWARELTQ